MVYIKFYILQYNPHYRGTMFKYWIKFELRLLSSYSADPITFTNTKSKLPYDYEYCHTRRCLAYTRAEKGHTMCGNTSRAWFADAQTKPYQGS